MANKEGLGTKLVGKTIKLNPYAGGMFYDHLNKKNLNFFSDGNDSLVFEEGMNPELLLRGIEHGLLRVFDGDKDVSVEFGGPEQMDFSARRVPIVELPSAKITDADKPLIEFLNRNNEKDIIRDLTAITDIGVLNRLEELEKMGKNPVFCARQNILNKIYELQDKINGPTARKIDGYSEVVRVK